MAEFYKNQKEEIYKIYVTDCLKIIAQNTANFSGGNVIKSRYSDLIQPQKNNIPKKSSAEILANINRKLAQIRGEENG